MKKFKQGDIVVVPFPFSDLSKSKLRPCLVISNHKLENVQEVIILPIVGKNYRDGLGYDISNEMVEVPLPKNPSQVRLHRISGISQKIVIAKVNKIKEEDLKKILAKFKSLIKT